MSDATTTLRALAAACEECLQAARNIPDNMECIRAQRVVLMDSLPDDEGWERTAATLRAMADTVAALEAERDALRAEVARLTRVLAVEQGDESSAPPGWTHDIDLTDDDAVREYVWTGPSATVCGSPYDGWRVESAHTGRIVRALYDTAIEAMEAAACDRLGVDHG